MAQDNDPLEEIKVLFFTECEELLEALQDGLASLQDTPDDNETINTVFRAVHSIKGGAGAFGLDELVSFAHVFETSLDQLRSGELNFTDDISRIYFESFDVLTDLVQSGRQGTVPETTRHKTVLDQLATLSGPPKEEADIQFEVVGLALDLDLDLDPSSSNLPDRIATNHFAIKFHPLCDLYATNNEPLFLIRALQKLGDTKVKTNRLEVPTLTEWDVSQSFLSWDIDVVTEHTRETIEEVFDFVDGHCQLSISVVDDADPGAGVERQADAEEDDPKSELENDKIKNSSVSEIKVDQPNVKATPAPTIRVELGKVDRLMNLVGEMVINQAMLSQSVLRSETAPALDVTQKLDEFSQLTREVQDCVMSIRAQPAKPLFRRMGRVVREASSVLGKTVNLKTVGEMTEIDKTLIERLADPLTHLIRNAVDHGLETSDEREALGKPKAGLIALTATHQSGRINIEIEDDGAGLNREKILANARQRNLVSVDEQLTESQIDELLFMPGFSTADEISSLSGRGVGLDVVKTEIEALGGSVSTTSVMGKGTKFSISLPLTLAIMEGMIPLEKVNYNGRSVLVMAAAI